MYELIVIDYKNRQETVFSSRKLFDMDCFTYNFVNKQDILKKFESKYNRKFKNVIIKSSFQNREKYIYDIMYKNNSFPDEDLLINKYATFLFNNKDKIIAASLSFASGVAANKSRMALNTPVYVAGLLRGVRPIGD